MDNESMDKELVGQSEDNLQPLENNPGDKQLSAQEMPGDTLIPPNLQTASLPALLRQGVEQFTLPHEAATFLLSTLAVTSGLLINVSGRYKSGRSYPNLFLLIVAPSASGKGVMDNTRTCIEMIHEEMVANSSKGASPVEPDARGTKKSEGDKAPLNVVVIPGNITASKMIQHLKWNDMAGCPSTMLESEIDTLNNAINAEHGDFGDMMRKIFHNEPIQMSRRKDNEYIEVRRPKMSLALSGTMNQVKSLITNSEDGLYSRFMVYYMDSQTAWADVEPCESCEDHSDFFQRQAAEYKRFWDFTSQNPLEVKLRPAQWSTLNRYFEQEHLRTLAIGNPNFSSVVKRHAVILHKICMTLTALRRFQEGSTDGVWFCAQEDFDNAWAIIATSMAHSGQIFKSLPGAAISGADQRRKNLYDALPDSFTTRDLLAKAKVQGVTENMAEKYLAAFVRSKVIERVSHANYRKICHGGLEG